MGKCKLCNGQSSKDCERCLGTGTDLQSDVQDLQEYVDFMGTHAPPDCSDFMDLEEDDYDY